MTRDTRVEGHSGHAEDKTAELPVRGPGWDPWRGLTAHTPARIGLGRAGAAARTEVHLAFQAAHAAARDAVHVPWDLEALRAELDGVVVASRAGSRQEYLLRPDLGRQLAEVNHADLAALRRDLATPWDVVLVLSNGLSTEGLQRHGAGLTRELLAAFAASELEVAPVVLVPDARVALGDPIGAQVGARAVVIVVGERPGLSASDSLGIYLTLLTETGGGLTDADRNCISNVHPPAGLDYAQAAAKCAWLLNEALRRGYSGVRLKDESPNGLTLVRSLEEA